MAPLTAYHRTPLRPSGVSHAVSCRLFDTRSTHLITARENTLTIWEITLDDEINHLRTHTLHGIVTSLSVVETLQSKRDGKDRLLVSFEQAKMSLLEWNENDDDNDDDEGVFDLVPVSLHTFEKLPQLSTNTDLNSSSQTTLIAHDPNSRMTVLHLPTNSGGDGTLAVLPWFTEELDLEGLGIDKQGWEQGGAQIPYAPSHLIPLTSLQPTTVPSTSIARSSTLNSSSSSSNSNVNAFLPNSPPPIRNVISMTFLPGFTEPTLALLYAPDYTWSGRLEHLAHNHLVSLVTLSTRTQQNNNNNNEQESSSLPTIATLISTSPPLPYSLISIQPLPLSMGIIGSVLLKSSNGLLVLDIQGGKLVGVGSNDWFKKDFPPGRPLPIGLIDSENTTTTTTIGECLEGSVIQFLGGDRDVEQDHLNNNKGLIFCKSGKILQLSVEKIGRSISGLKLLENSENGERCEGGVSCSVRIGKGKLFVGSEQSCSKLYRVETQSSSTTTIVNESTIQPRVGQEEEQDEMMDEDEEDIYGDSTNKSTLKPSPKFNSSLLQGALASLNTIVANDSETTNGSLRLTVLDKLESYGSIRSLVMGLVDEESSVELVGATGAGKQAGLTIFHRTLPTTCHRTLPLDNINVDIDVDIVPVKEEREEEDGKSFVGMTNGIWDLELGPRIDELGRESLLITSNEKGTFFYQTLQSNNGQDEGGLKCIKFEQSFQTIYATSMGNGGDEKIVVIVSNSEIKTFDRDLNLLQTITLSSRLPAYTSARATSTQTYLTLHSGPRSSNLKPSLYRYELETKSLIKVEFEEEQGEGEDVGSSSRIAVWRDSDRKGELRRPTKKVKSSRDNLQIGKFKNEKNLNDQPDSSMYLDEGDEEDEDEDLYGTSSSSGNKKVVPKIVEMEIENELEEIQVGKGDEQIVKNEDVGNDERDWLVKVDQSGTFKIYLLPTMLEVFRCQSLSLLPSVLSDSPTSNPQPIPSSIDPDDLLIDRIQLITLGSSSSSGKNQDDKLHLLVWNTNGTMVLYDTFPAKVPPHSSSSTGGSSNENTPRLGLKFVKSLVHHVPITTPRSRKGGAAGGANANLPPPIRKEIIQFSRLGSISGAFITGEEPYWLVKNRQGPARCFETSQKNVYGFTQSRKDQQDFMYTTATTFEGSSSSDNLQLATIPTETVSLNHELPLSFIEKDRTYSYLTFDLDSGLYVGATLNETKFVAFNDDGVPIFREQAPGLVEPTNYQSTLELIVPGSWEAIDGYEFRQNEFVCTAKTVSLHSKSRANGMRDFIAVGTTVYRGEDLSAKGGIYIFEVVPIVPNPSTPKQSHLLKLRFFEDTKSIVGNICDLNGYLFLSMGQKLYARAFEQDEVLIAVGFLDLGVHVTSLTSLKNFLLIGDAMQSVALVAFQEDPYKLVFLGRDYRPSRISSANFLVNEGRVSFVTGDDKGVLRMFEYDPSNIASHAGQRLLCRTEYHAGSESIATMLFAKHLPNEDAKQNGILFGGIDGSLYTLVPVRDAVFKRLQSLQATMSRHVLHFGGLNPRGYRIVKNDTVSRAITKGILDGDLLSKFEYLSLDLQTELALNCGTDADTVLANLRNLRVYE